MLSSKANARFSCTVLLFYEFAGKFLNAMILKYEKVIMLAQTFVFVH